MGVGEDVVAIIAGSALILVAILGSVFLAALRMLRGSSRSPGHGVNPDEARLMQEIHHGLQRMEERVESLETLLIEQSRARKERSQQERFSELEGQ